MHRPAHKGVVAIHAGRRLGVQKDIAPEVVGVIGMAGAIHKRGILCGIVMTWAAIRPDRGSSPHYLLD